MDQTPFAITTDPSRFEVPTREELRELRLVAGLDVIEVAERGEWSPSTVHRWEQGDQDPTLRNLQRVLEIYESELSGQQQLSRG